MRSASVLLFVIVLLSGCSPAAPQSSDTPDRLAPSESSGAPSDSRPPENQAELAKLEGKWICVSFHVDGIEFPPAEWIRFRFDGDQMITESNNSKPEAVKFYHDPHAEPKQLDTSIMVDGVEEISKGIYSIEGDVLKHSWRIVGERPVDHQSRRQDGKIVMILRRAKD